MAFWRDIVFPIVLAIIAFGGIVFLVKITLRFFGFDIPIIRFAIVLAIWYFVGPIIYDWLMYAVVRVYHEAIEIIYMPIQSIIEAFEKLV